MRVLLLIFVFLNACTLTKENFYHETMIPEIPSNGFNRSQLFPKYYSFLLGSFTESLMYKNIKSRTNWIAKNTNFKQNYSAFNAELIAINQLPENSFTWQERIMFADALDLVIFVVNQPEFLEEMKKEALEKPFMNNERTKIVSPEQIVNYIRSSKLYFYLGKDTLSRNILAQATIGGFNNVIWFRNDVDYQNEYGVYSLAVVLFHEMTHNLGFLHSSNVPYGIQDPFLRVIERVHTAKALEFISLTPYYEKDFLTRIRTTANYSLGNDNSMVIHKDYVSDIGEHILEIQ